MNSAPVWLFDIDHTLFDTSIFWDNFTERLFIRSGSANRDKFLHEVARIYGEIRLALGVVPPGVLAAAVVRELDLLVSPENLEASIWADENFDGCLYPEVPAVLGSLRERGQELGIFSSGDDGLQRRKIAPLSFLLTAEHIHIYPDKTKHIRDLARLYMNRCLFILDDLPIILTDLRHVLDCATTIWVRRIPLRGNVPVVRHEPHYVVSDLKPILQISGMEPSTP